MSWQGDATAQHVGGQNRPRRSRTELLGRFRGGDQAALGRVQPLASALLPFLIPPCSLVVSDATPLPLLSLFLRTLLLFAKDFHLRFVVAFRRHLRVRKIG
jgi:hypothetical protein